MNPSAQLSIAEGADAAHVTPCACRVGSYCERRQVVVQVGCLRLCRAIQSVYDDGPRLAGRITSRPAAERRFPPQAETFAEAGPCVHRLGVVRRAKCQVCGQRDVTADVYGCSKLGECTLRYTGIRSERAPNVKVANCLACPFYEASIG